MNCLIVYFSFTSTVRTLAQAIRTELEGSSQTTISRLEPRTSHSYWGWLPRSFLPNWRVPIKPTITGLASYDLVCLGFPKWTFSCPPVNQYIQAMKGCQEKRMALFMCHRSFDEKRYLNHMIRRVSKTGALVVATLSVKQGVVREGTYQEALDSFCRQAGSVWETW